MTHLDGRRNGATAAYGKRVPWKAMVRRALYRVLRIVGVRFQRAFPDYYEFVPSVASVEEYADLTARVNCYLGGSGIPMVLQGTHHDLDPSVVPYMAPELVRDPGWVSKRPKGEGHLVVHRVTPSSVLRMATRRGPSTVVDPRLFRRSESMYFELRNRTTWPRYEPVELGLQRLRALSRPGSKAFILATGPSALNFDFREVDADVRITCNSAVRDFEKIKEFRPNIICFTDPVFHFGPSRYAAQFRRDAVRASEEVDALVVCGHQFAGALLDIAPGLRDRLVVLPWQDGGPWRWPTDHNPTVRQASNVMTTLMLPIALMLADEIAIAGSDGRQPSENYFWKHNPTLQYSDELMRTVFDAHPAFFRDTDYRDYYDEFCANFESLLTLGEDAGKTIRPVTPSWIPCLVDRGAIHPVVAD